MHNTQSRWSPSRPSVLLCLLLLGLCWCRTTQAENHWDHENNTNWWFDPVNWSASFNGLPALPAMSDSGGFTEAVISNGWDLAGEGVVYDPLQDPHFAAAATLAFPSGSGLRSYLLGDFQREHLWRLEISRSAASDNRLTVKSGDLLIASTTIVGRSGSAQSVSEGRLVQTGGRIRVPIASLDLGYSDGDGDGWGNGVYEYHGGTLEVSLAQNTASGIRVAHGRSSTGTGPSGISRFVVHNPTSGGHIRTRNYQSASYRGDNNSATNPLLDPNGSTRGVAITEFHYENGATRPLQITGNLVIHNGLHTDTGGATSSRLDLQLHEAPCAGSGCIPENLGLFDVDFDLGFGTNGGSLQGVGSQAQMFSSVDGSTHFPEGSTVAASFGGTEYRWTISYTGDIAWNDAENSVVGTIQGPGMGKDVVLIGLDSESGFLPGDFDGDSDIDGHDFLRWQQGASPKGLFGQSVSSADLAEWQANYGSPPTLTAIPEPSTLLLVAALGIGLALRQNPASR